MARAAFLVVVMEYKAGEHAPLSPSPGMTAAVKRQKNWLIAPAFSSGNALLPSADCAVCRKGFASRIQYKCARCKEREVGEVVVGVFATAISLTIFALLWYMVSVTAGIEENGFLRTFMKYVPVQGLKIVIVVWQIITQVSRDRVRGAFFLESLTCVVRNFLRVP